MDCGTNGHQKIVYFNVGALGLLMSQVFHTYAPGSHTENCGFSRTGTVLCSTSMTKHGTQCLEYTIFGYIMAQRE